MVKKEGNRSKATLSTLFSLKKHPASDAAASGPKQQRLFRDIDANRFCNKIQAKTSKAEKTKKMHDKSQATMKLTPSDMGAKPLLNITPMKMLISTKNVVSKRPPRPG